MTKMSRSAKRAANAANKAAKKAAKVQDATPTGPPNVSTSGMNRALVGQQFDEIVGAQDLELMKNGLPISGPPS